MVIGYMSETLTYASVAPSDYERSSTSETEGSVKEMHSQSGNDPDLIKEIDSELTRKENKKEPIQPKSCCDCFTFWICKCLDSIGDAFSNL